MAKAKVQKAAKKRKVIVELWAKLMLLLLLINIIFL